jgi:anti-sigma-K factor RskA
MDVSERHEEMLDLCAGYALGSLDEADRVRLEAHLADGCEQCEAALADFFAATVALASFLPVASPPASLRGRILDAARAMPVEEMDVAPASRPARKGGRIVELPRRRLSAWTWGFAAAAAALAVASVWSGQEARRLRSEVNSLRDQVVSLRTQLDDQILWTGVLTSTDARVAALAPTPAGDPALRGRATYDAVTRRAVVILENVRAPKGRDYELWAIRGAAPASLGVLAADAKGRVILRLEDVGDPATLNALAVSLEPRGGSPDKTKPSGPVVMLGAFGG